MHQTPACTSQNGPILTEQINSFSAQSIYGNISHREIDNQNRQGPCHFGPEVNVTIGFLDGRHSTDNWFETMQFGALTRVGSSHVDQSDYDHYTDPHQGSSFFSRIFPVVPEEKQQYHESTWSDCLNWIPGYAIFSH